MNHIHQDALDFWGIIKESIDKILSFDTKDNKPSPATEKRRKHAIRASTANTSTRRIVNDFTAYKPNPLARSKTCYSLTELSQLSEHDSSPVAQSRRPNSRSSRNTLGRTQVAGEMKACDRRNEMSVRRKSSSRKRQSSTGSSRSEHSRTTSRPSRKRTKSLTSDRGVNYAESARSRSSSRDHRGNGEAYSRRKSPGHRRSSTGLTPSSTPAQNSRSSSREHRGSCEAYSRRKSPGHRRSSTGLTPSSTPAQNSRSSSREHRGSCEAYSRRKSPGHRRSSTRLTPSSTPAQNSWSSSQDHRGSCEAFSRGKSPGHNRSSTRLTPSPTPAQNTFAWDGCQERRKSDMMTCVAPLSC